MARQVVRLPLRVFVGREILQTLRAEVNGIVADARGVLFVRAFAFCQDDFNLLTVT